MFFLFVCFFVDEILGMLSTLVCSLTCVHLSYLLMLRPSVHDAIYDTTTSKDPCRVCLLYSMLANIYVIKGMMVMMIMMMMMMI